jgi:hypothetical protein
MMGRGAGGEWCAGMVKVKVKVKGWIAKHTAPFSLPLQDR